MAQRRYTEYLSDDDSFQFNAFLIGLIPAGLYRGFDFTPSNSLFLSLNHNTTGYNYPKITGVVSTKTGVIRSKQGVSISEDAPISIQVNANNTANPRIDLVICEHQYQILAGGLTAEYFIIQGTPNAIPVAPVLTNPNFQVVIGTLYLPANTSSLNAAGVIYTRSSLPELGNNNLQVQQNTLQQNFNTLNSTVSSFITSIQNQFNTLNQEMVVWRNFYKPQLGFDGMNIEWKYTGEPDNQATWRDLAVAIITDASGPGMMEVRILEAQYFPTAYPFNPLNPTARDHNVLEFNTQISLPVGSTYWTHNREWIAPQTKSYRFLLDSLELVCTQNVDYAAIHAYKNLYPFPVTPLSDSHSEIRDWIVSRENGFIRIELIKNGVVAYSVFNKFDIVNGTQVGDNILIPVIDQTIAVVAGDKFSWRISTTVNYNIPQEVIFGQIIVTGPQYSLEIGEYRRQANTAWIQKEHFEIGTGHWTIFGA